MLQAANVLSGYLERREKTMIELETISGVEGVMDCTLLKLTVRERWKTSVLDKSQKESECEGWTRGE